MQSCMYLEESANLPVSVCLSDFCFPLRLVTCDLDSEIIFCGRRLSLAYQQLVTAAFCGICECRKTFSATCESPHLGRSLTLGVSPFRIICFTLQDADCLSSFFPPAVKKKAPLKIKDEVFQQPPPAPT